MGTTGGQETTAPERHRAHGARPICQHPGATPYCERGDQPFATKAPAGKDSFEGQRCTSAPSALRRQRIPGVEAVSRRNLGGRVNSEFPHLQAFSRAVAPLSSEERITWIRQERWIQYPRAKRILERLVDLIDYPPHDRMPCLVIYGATGMGKTRIVQKFLRDNRAHFDRKLGRTRVPVVSIQMPPAPVERDLYEEILVAMCGVFAYGTSVTTLRHRIRALARQLEVRLLIIDEIHSLLAGTFREQRIILNAIRFLANDLQIPLVCLGTEEANRALMTDQQLADRFAAAELPAWENDAAFEQLLLSFESVLPLRRPSEFRDPKTHQRILSLTEGVLGRICRLMEMAAIEAIRSGEERITLSLLKDDLVTESLVSIADRRTRRFS